MTFRFDYNITSDPEFVQDIGHGEIKVTNISPKLRGNPKVVVDPITGDKSHNIHLEYVDLPTADFDAKLEGEDIADIINLYSDTIIDVMKQQVMTNFSDPMK